ncbi:MAG: hypothetical protein AMJ46_13615, partial [Latescibacteria bacterium DG_63]
MDEKKESHGSESFRVSNFFRRRRERMSTKSIWLLSFLALALVFGGFASTAEALFAQITDLDIEGTDAEGESSRNNFGIRGVKIYVEGEIDERDDENIGRLQIQLQDGSWMDITEGDLEDGDHMLDGSGGTTIDANGDITTNNDGEFYLTFFLPFDLLEDPATDGLDNDGDGAIDEAGEIRLALAHDVGNVEDPNPDVSGWLFQSRLRFWDSPSFPGAAAPTAGTVDDTFAVQTPRVDDADLDDDVYRNGDLVQIDIEMETDDATATLGPWALPSEEIERVTLLPDFSYVDSAFTGVKVAQPDPPGPYYDVTTWDNVEGNRTLDDLIRDVNEAKRVGRLEIIDDGGGDYEIYYTISDSNVNSPGMKKVRVYAIDFPEGTRPDIDDMNLIFDTVFGDGDLNTIDFDPATQLNILEWQSGTFDTEDLNLDNAAPNFDFVVVNPFVNPPEAKGYDEAGNAIAPGVAVADDQWVYVFKEGDTVSVMVQIDPHDLTIDELEEIDDDQVSQSGNEDATIDDVEVIGDISDLLDPTKVDLLTDANANGIPDRAEVRAFYAGSGGSTVSGSDDDFDGEAADVDDDEDTTENGFNERYLFLINFTIDGNFKGVSGSRPATTEPLSLRFAIIDAANNITHYSMWREELYNPDLRLWRTVDVADWGRESLEPLDGDYNPVYVDDVFYLRGNVNWAADGWSDGPSSISYAPTPARAGMPEWSPGYTILTNWDQPSRILIDAAPPSVSRVASLELERQNPFVDLNNNGVKDGGEVDDAYVLAGAAVIPVTGDTGQRPPTGFTAAGKPILLGDLGSGNFIYEIGGDGFVTVTAHFPSDNDVKLVKWMISADGATYRPMKGTFTGDVNVPGLYDMAGDWRDQGYPGAEDGQWHDGINGDDDDDRRSDLADREVDDADRAPQSDGLDNDADDLVDANDLDEDGLNADFYDLARDEDEDGIMDEDEYVVETTVDPTTNEVIASWTFDPVRMARVLNLLPNKAYAIKAEAYDLAGGVLDTGAAPISVIFRVTGPGVEEPAGTAKAALYRDDTLVTADAIAENRVYQLRATTTGAVTSVTFQYSVEPEREASWENVPEYSGNNPDEVSPFRISWRPTLTQLARDLWIDADADGVEDFTDTNGNGVWDPGEAAQDPRYEAGDRLYIRAVAGKFGALGRYEVVSGLTIDPQGFAPYEYDPPITVPPAEMEQAADIIVAVTDAGAPVMVMKEVGIDDDLSDGALAPVAQDVLLVAESEATDVSDAVFQYAKVFPDGTIAQWEDVPSTVDLTILPNAGVRAVSKWNTTVVTPGRYDLRCVATDIAGNSSPVSAPIVHIVVGAGKYAAFIVDPEDGDEVSGDSWPIVARIYADWDANDDGTISGAEEAAAAVEVNRVVFQYREAGGAWVVADSVSAPTTVETGYADWHGDLTIYGLQGTYYVRAQAEDDKGNVNDGVEISIIVKGMAKYRTAISNFPSIVTEEDEIDYQNRRVSMEIAREGTDEYIDARNYKDNDAEVETIGIKIQAEELAGTLEPEDVTFEYRVNRLSDPADPKGGPDKPDDLLFSITGADADTYKDELNVPTISDELKDEFDTRGYDVTALAVKKERASKRWTITNTTADGIKEPYFVRFESGQLDVYRGWVEIATDDGRAWEKDRWEIAPGHELHNLPAATVVYVRARAHKEDTEDAYEDEGNFVPYVAFIFEETVEPTCSIARIERNGVSLSGLGALPDVTRAAGGVLNFIPD